jgi:hypothetical protein
MQQLCEAGRKSAIIQSAFGFHTKVLSRIGGPHHWLSVLLSEHDPEKACPGLDPGWKPVFGKDHAPTKS